MKYVVIDTEANGALRNKAHPFDPKNRLVAVGARRLGSSTVCYARPGDDSFGNYICHLGRILSDEDIWVVGFNIRYDLHWLRRCGCISRSSRLKVWDCQLAHFILHHQQNTYPSLDTACQEYGLPLKKDILLHYLNLGLDVSDIPEEELLSYLKGDLLSTEDLFLKQTELIEAGGYWELFRLQCQDLVVLADMEYNGLKYDLEKSKDLARACEEKERAITEELNGLVGHALINWNSTDHLSAVLYGGVVPVKTKRFVGVYKTGAKVGQARYQYDHSKLEFPRLVEPLKGSELAKPGYWSTAENVLLELPAKGMAKEIIKRVLKLAEFSKIRGTYYEGIPRRFEEYGWTDELVHGQLNQCVAVTGRTASSKPNLQNNPYDSKECFISRYD